MSSDRQEKEDYSIPAQQKLVREYAAAQGIAVAREFAEAETSKRAGREQFDAMVAHLAGDRGCRVVLVEKTDRLYRNLKDYVTIDELGVAIHFVKEGVVLSDESRSGEKFVHGIKLLMAKNFIDNLSEETRKGMAEKAAQGGYPARAPLGYLNVEGPDRRRAVVPDPVRGPAVAKLFGWYAAGAHSLDALSAAAREAGLRSARGTPVPRAGVHQMLRTRMDTGRFLWRGELQQGSYEPLVSEELWLKVQGLLAERGRKKPRFVRHDFAFSRLVSCGHCGCALVGEVKKGKYVYYHCTGYRGKCPEPFTREGVLSEQFAGVLRRLVLDDEVVGLVAEALRQSHRDVSRFHAEAVARLQAEATKLQGRVEAMYGDKLDGVVTGEFFARKSQEWRAEQEALLRQVGRHRAASQTYFEEGVQLLELSQRAAELFSAQAPKEQRRLLDFVLSNCTWANGKLEVEFRQPFALLAVAAETVETKPAAGGGPDGRCPGRLPGLDSNQRPAD